MIKKLSFMMFVLMFVFVAVFSGYSSTIAAAGTLNAGTPVYCTLATDISSYGSNDKSGQLIRFTTSQDVIVNGVVAIPRGTGGTLNILQSQHATSIGRPGEIIYTGTYILLGDKTIPIQYSNSVQGSSNMVLSIVSIVILPFGIIWGWFINGDEATVKAGTQFTVTVAQNTAI
ncbi:MAG: hypothetical protein WCV63_10960 [Negativicutes bacterium]|jgi:hypothetical protein